MRKAGGDLQQRMGVRFHSDGERTKSLSDRKTLAACYWHSLWYLHIKRQLFNFTASFFEIQWNFDYPLAVGIERVFADSRIRSYKITRCVLQIQLFIVGLLHATLYVFGYEYFRIGQDWEKMICSTLNTVWWETHARFLVHLTHTNTQWLASMAVNWNWQITEVLLCFNNIITLTPGLSKWEIFFTLFPIKIVTVFLVSLMHTVTWSYILLHVALVTSG
jgi:hypothetical protein